jgi:hypothetical protein
MTPRNLGRRTGRGDECRGDLPSRDFHRGRMVRPGEALLSRPPVVRLVGATSRRIRLSSSFAPPQWRRTWIIPGSPHIFEAPTRLPPRGVDKILRSTHETERQDTAPKPPGSATVRGENARWDALRASSPKRPYTCRLHGGMSPGAPRGPRNGNYRNGSWTLEALEERRWLRSLVSTFAKFESKS